MWDHLDIIHYLHTYTKKPLLCVSTIKIECESGLRYTKESNVFVWSFLLYQDKSCFLFILLVGSYQEREYLSSYSNEDFGGSEEEMEYA